MKQLYQSYIESPLGLMVAVADENFLYLLDFIDSKGIEKKTEKLIRVTQACVVSGQTVPLSSIAAELNAYFAGTLTEFKTPLGFLSGTCFQQAAWSSLRTISYGSTKSYAEQAQALAKPTAFRAVANANASNQLVIIVPCHRVIGANGLLTGYAGGMERKRWLLEHERRCLAHKKL